MRLVRRPAESCMVHGRGGQLGIRLNPLINLRLTLSTLFHPVVVAEMKEKIAIVDNKTEILRNENLAKEKALAKEQVSTVQRTACNMHGEPPPKRGTAR